MVANEYQIVECKTGFSHRRILHTVDELDALELMNLWNTMVPQFKYILGEEMYDLNKGVELKATESRSGRDIPYFIREVKTYGDARII